MIRMTNLHKIYRTEHVETHALSEFTLTIEPGEFVSVMGPSGSGKTTFLNVAGLLDTFDRGDYFLDEADVSRLNDREMSRIRNEKIGFIFQSYNLIPDLNVFDNVDVPLRYREMPAKVRREAIEESLDVVGLSSRLKHFPSQLSGGQQQRVAVARALVGSPKLILADEPTGNLDSAMANEIMDLLEKINEMGTTVVIVTHDAELAQRSGARSMSWTAASSISRPRIAMPLSFIPRLWAARPLEAERKTVLTYQIKNAVRSMKRNPALSLLLIAGIGLGIAVSTAFITTYYLMAGDPIPHKSDQLFYVEMDSWNPDRPYDDIIPKDPRNRSPIETPAASWRAISPPPSVMFRASLTVQPESENEKPYREDIRMCFNDFFAMFEVPFLYGGPWRIRAMRTPSGGGHQRRDQPQAVWWRRQRRSILRIENEIYTIVGCRGRLAAAVQVLRSQQLPFGSQRRSSAFQPRGPLEIDSAGNDSNWKYYDGDEFADWLQSESVWLQMWVQLDTASRERVSGLSRCLRHGAEEDRPVSTSRQQPPPGCHGDDETVRGRPRRGQGLLLISHHVSWWSVRSISSASCWASFWRELLRWACVERWEPVGGRCSCSTSWNASGRFAGRRSGIGLSMIALDLINRLFDNVRLSPRLQHGHGGLFLSSGRRSRRRDLSLLAHLPSRSGHVSERAVIGRSIMQFGPIFRALMHNKSRFWLITSGGGPDSGHRCQLHQHDAGSFVTTTSSLPATTKRI